VNSHRNLERVLGATAVTGTLFFLVHLYAMSTRDIGALAFTLFLTITALSPIAVWWWLLHLCKSTAVRLLLTLTGAAAFAFGFFVYYDGGFVHLDALYGVVFVFLPLLQILAIGLIYTLGVTYERKKSKAA